MATSEVKRGFGGYTRHFWSANIPKKPYNHLTWVNRRYTPADPRSIGPAPTHKLQAGSVSPSSIQTYWVTRPEPTPQSYSRREGFGGACPSSPATRSEEWSTLRQMLPSKGHYVRQRPQRWGTSEDLALPDVSHTRPNQYPKIYSVMTRYTSPPLGILSIK